MRYVHPGAFLGQHVGGGDSGPRERSLAVLSRGSAHVPFQEGETGAARATRDVGARGASSQVLQADGAHVVHLVGMAPDVDKALLAHVSPSDRKRAPAALYRHLAEIRPD